MMVDFLTLKTFLPALKEHPILVCLDRLNQGIDMLSRDNIYSGEWRLHTQVVQMIWSSIRRREEDLFASEDNFHCPIYVSRQRDALAHNWPCTRLYAFTQIPCFLRLSNWSGKSDAQSPWWPHSGGIRCCSLSWFSCFRQPLGQYHRGRTLSHKQREWFDFPTPSYLAP